MVGWLTTGDQSGRGQELLSPPLNEVVTDNPAHRTGAGFAFAKRCRTNVDAKRGRQVTRDDSGDRKTLLPAPDHKSTARKHSRNSSAGSNALDRLLHSRAVDLVDIDAVTDGVDHGQGELAAQMLAKFLQTAKQIVRCFEDWVTERQT